MFGRGQRTDLDAEDGENLADQVRSEIARVLREEEDGEGKSLGQDVTSSGSGSKFTTKGKL